MTKCQHTTRPDPIFSLPLSRYQAAILVLGIILPALNVGCNKDKEEQGSASTAQPAVVAGGGPGESPPAVPTPSTVLTSIPGDKLPKPGPDGDRGAANMWLEEQFENKALSVTVRIHDIEVEDSDEAGKHNVSLVVYDPLRKDGWSLNDGVWFANSQVGGVPCRIELWAERPTWKMIDRDEATKLQGLKGNEVTLHCTVGELDFDEGDEEGKLKLVIALAEIKSPVQVPPPPLPPHPPLPQTTPTTPVGPIAGLPEKQPALDPKLDPIARDLIGTDPKARDAAISAAKAAGEAARPIAGHLCAGAANAATAARSPAEDPLVINFLLALEKVYPNLFPHIQVLLVDNNAHNHVAASQALAQMGYDAEPATPVLLAHLKRVGDLKPEHSFYFLSESMLTADLAALAAVAPTNRDVLKAVLEATRFTYPMPKAKELERGPAPVRRAALTALGAIAEANPAARAQVVKRLQEALAESGNESTAATALGRCGRAAEAARDALSRLRLTSPTKNVRDAAAAAIARINRDTVTAEHLDKVGLKEMSVSARVYVTAFRLVGAADEARTEAAERFAALSRTADALKAAAALTRLPDADKSMYSKVREIATRTLTKWGTDETRLRGWIAPKLIECGGDPACSAPAFNALTPWGKADGRLAEQNTAGVIKLLDGGAAERAMKTLVVWGEAHAKVREQALDPLASLVRGKKANASTALNAVAGWAENHADFRPKALPVLADFAGDGSDQSSVDALVRSDLDAVRLLKKRLADPTVKDKAERQKAEKLLAAVKPALVRRGEAPAHQARCIEALGEAGPLTAEAANWLLRIMSRDDGTQIGRVTKALENLRPDDVPIKVDMRSGQYVAGELYQIYSDNDRAPLRPAAVNKSLQTALKNMGLDSSSYVAFHFSVILHPKAPPEQKNGTWWALAGKLDAESFALWTEGRPREQQLEAAKAYWDRLVALVRADPRKARQFRVWRTEPMLSFAKHFGEDAKFMAPFLIEELEKHLAGKAAAVGNRDDHLLPAYDALILIGPAGGNDAKKVLQTAQAQEFFDAETTARYRKAIAEVLKKFK